MSYKELRNFTEMLRSLGYPRLISLENFRTPNFKLVAEILAWLLNRYDNDYDIPMEVDTEQDRVIFIKTAAQFLIQKARIKINPKKLYQADGYAVQELLKVASLLYAAIQHNETSSNDQLDDNFSISSVTAGIQDKLNELRVSRQLAVQITEQGASVHELLGKEVNLREQRTAALARQLELADVEKSLRATIKTVQDEIKTTLQNLDNIASDETTLDAKIEKKRTDLERQQKRLTQLQAVRPAYMDEYEKLEKELQEMYNVYIQKFRNLAYLEQIQNEYDRSEQERVFEAELSLRKMAERMREEEKAKMAQADEQVNDAGINDDELALKQPAAAQPKVYGSMTGAGLSDEDDDDDDDDSVISDDDDEELEGAAGGRPQRRLSRPPVHRQTAVSAGDGIMGEDELSEPLSHNQDFRDEDKAPGTGDVARIPSADANEESDDDF